jgi:hypothetical protein
MATEEVAVGSVDGPEDLGARLRLLLQGSVENLVATWDEPRALLPFSSRLTGGAIVNDYDNPIAVRYTINSLLGLLRAARAGVAGLPEAEVRRRCAAFFARDPGRITLPADQGLATLLHAELGADPAFLADRVRELQALLGSSALNIQDVAWILWGGAAAARAGVPAGVDVVATALDRITVHLLHPQTGLPRHSASRWRRDVVSFGSLTYFLRAMHEAAEVLGDDHPRRLLEGGVAHALRLQGPRGEWPWMIDCATGTIIDPHPVFAVHQDSMAMLFLLPARDRGLPGVAAAIDRSLTWDFGANELGLMMVVQEPFFAYRSIERRERAPRVRRYLRSRRRRRDDPWRPPKVRLNDECRSYHLGWILYAWAGRPEAAT